MSLESWNRRTAPPATKEFVDRFRKFLADLEPDSELTWDDVAIRIRDMERFVAEWPEPAKEPAHPRRGFTLFELLVVITIILLVSAVTLPAVVGMIREQPVISAAQLLQASIAQARDAAARAGVRGIGGEIGETRTAAEERRGLRFLPESVTRLDDGSIDPSRPLVCSEAIPLSIPPAYQEGAASTYPEWADPGWTYPARVTGGRPCLVLEESPGRWVAGPGGYTWVLNSPTSWAWNVRAGDRVEFQGRAYVVCGPITLDNPEQFVNYGPPGTAPGFVRTYTAPDGRRIDARPETLQLVNGRDDDKDGYVDNGWDGLDNEPDGTTDELDEWTEREMWTNDQLKITADQPYRVIRRASPSGEPRGLVLPRGAVIDLTGWGGTSGRSRLAVDRHSGAVDIMFDKTGRFSYDTPYGTSSSIGMDLSTFAHFWIGGREDIADPAAPMPAPKAGVKLLTVGKDGDVSILDVDPDDPARAYLDARRGMR
jgi:prepilin-type N-terminal cleavage/methylation domain-containing protein